MYEEIDAKDINCHNTINEVRMWDQNRLIQDCDANEEWIIRNWAQHFFERGVPFVVVRKIDKDGKLRRSIYKTCHWIEK